MDKEIYPLPHQPSWYSLPLKFEEWKGGKHYRSVASGDSGEYDSVWSGTWEYTRQLRDLPISIVMTLSRRKAKMAQYTMSTRKRQFIAYIELAINGSSISDSKHPLGHFEIGTAAEAKDFVEHICLRRWIFEILKSIYARERGTCVYLPDGTPYCTFFGQWDGELKPAMSFTSEVRSMPVPERLLLVRNGFINRAVLVDRGWGSVSVSKTDKENKHYALPKDAPPPWAGGHSYFPH